MKAFSRVACVVALAFSIFVARAADTSDVEKEVLQLDATRIGALLKGDVKALDQLFSDGMVYIHSNGKIDTKQGYLTLLTSGSLTYVSLRYDPPQRAKAAGSDTVIVTGKAMIEAKNKAGQVTPRVLTTTTVYVRTATGWQVVSYQATPVP
jgi:ketosteroid isomerase-like protein